MSLKRYYVAHPDFPSRRNEPCYLASEVDALLSLPVTDGVWEALEKIAEWDDHPVEWSAVKKISHYRTIALAALSLRTAPPRLSGKELAEKHGINVRHNSDQIDFESGKRIAEEPDALPLPESPWKTVLTDEAADGRYILAIVGGSPVVTKYQDEWGTWYGEESDYSSEEIQYWMPLPAAPESQKGGQS